MEFATDVCIVLSNPTQVITMAAAADTTVAAAAADMVAADMAAAVAPAAVTEYVSKPALAIFLIVAHETATRRSL